jgi:hypothetical protein
MIKRERKSNGKTKKIHGNNEREREREREREIQQESSLA